MQQILAAIQAQAGPEQAVSARLLPSVAGAEQVTPIVDELEEPEETEKLAAEEAASAA